MKKPKSKTPKPQRWLYCLARGFCCVMARLLFRLKITGGDFDLLTGGGSENGAKQSSDNWGGFGGGGMRF